MKGHKASVDLDDRLEEEGDDDDNQILDLEEEEVNPGQSVVKKVHDALSQPHKPHSGCIPPLIEKENTCFS